MAWKANDHERPDNMHSTTERHERTFVQRPGCDKLGPVLLLVIAANKDQLRTWQIARQFRRLRRGHAVALANPWVVKDIADKGNNVGALCLHCVTQPTIVGPRLVKVGYCEDSEVHGDSAGISWLHVQIGKALRGRRRSKAAV